MSTKIYFNIRLTPKCYERITLDCINLENNVEILRRIVSEKTNVPASSLDLIFCGNLLEDAATIGSYGIRQGVTVHVLQKKENPLPRKINTITESDILHLVSAFKNAIKNPNYRNALQRLGRAEVLENIIVATPGLADDPIAISIIQDPELLTHMCDTSTVRRIVEAHPCLAEAAHYIVAVVHEEAVSTQSNLHATSSSGYSYSLDALSDDEEMDSSQSSDSQPRQLRLVDNYSHHITTAQLAAALASATSGTSVSQSPSTSSLASNTLITSEMFSNAMQQALTGVSSPIPGSGPSTSTSIGSDLGDLEAQSRQLSRHLQQMHELGLTDDALNLQALQATDWNVQEAINLVFSAIGSIRTSRDGEINDQDT